MIPQTNEFFRGELRIGFYTVDAFSRENPPGHIGESDVWSFAPQFVDMCSAIFLQHNAVRSGHETRDLVLAALLRRAIITTESVLNVLYHGLPEGAVGLVRTLLDIELNARLVSGDPTDKMARRYAAYHYFAGKRHGQKMVSDRDTRSMLQRYEGAFDETLDTVRRHEAWFEAPGFDEVRGEIQPGKPWHGHARAEDAFKAAGMNTDYYQSYDLGTFFIHATNIDFDFDAIVNGRVMLKPLRTDGEDLLIPTLGTALGHLYSVLELFANDKPLSFENGTLVVNGRAEPVGLIDALGILLGQVLSRYKLPDQAE